jgi:hypothetical protein
LKTFYEWRNKSKKKLENDMNDSWVVLGEDGAGNAPQRPAPRAQPVPVPVVDEEQEMLRLVTAVSECMAIIGQDSGFKLGEVSAAVR